MLRSEPKILDINRLLFVILFAFIMGIGSGHGQDHQTYPVTGDWEDDASWLGNSPGSPINNDDVAIYGRITRNGNLDINGSEFDVYDTLIIDGDLAYGGFSDLTVHTGGVLIVLGNMTGGAFSSTDINGDLVVTGDLGGLFTFVNTDDGNAYVYGDNTLWPVPASDGTETEEDLENDNPGLDDLVGDLLCNMSIDNPGNQTECENYVLPPITGTNLSGNEAYYAGPGGTGTQYDAGDNITASTTLYIYDENGSCTEEESFDITIEPIPVTSNCYRLPNL